MSELMLNSWKNGSITNKEHKSRNIALLTTTAELVIALVGTMVLSQSFVSFHVKDADINYYL
jgi:hypothetical protein